MRRLITTLALGLSLLGCGTGTPDNEVVPLLTGVSSCYAGGETGAAGLLLPEPVYGTSFNGRPVMWPVGFTGVRVYGGVKVLDATGNVVAATSKRYFISHGPVDDPEKQRLLKSIGAFTAAANCPYAWDFVDCDSPPTGSPELDVVERACRDR